MHTRPRTKENVVGDPQSCSSEEGMSCCGAKLCSMDDGTKQEWQASPFWAARQLCWPQLRGETCGMAP